MGIRSVGEENLSQLMPAIDWVKTASNIASLIDFLGDLTTVLVGLMTLIAFFRYKKKIGSAIKLLRINHINERVAEIRKTLDLILVAEMQKGRAQNVRALFGRLNGQLVPFCEVLPELKELQGRVDSIAHGAGQLNEPIRQQIAHEILAKIEGSKLLALNSVVGE